MKERTNRNLTPAAQTHNDRVISKARKAATKRREDSIIEIAKKVLGLETTETRNSDSLDFHDLAVWQIKKALEAAYKAGFEAGRK